MDPTTQPIVADQNDDIRFVEVEKRFGTVSAVRGLNLSIARGGMFSLLGPSGCGKTTTLRLIAGFEQPTIGAVFIRGRDVTAAPPYRRDFAMVFQNFALFPHLTVFENVAFGLRMRHVPRADRATRVNEALELVKLGGYGGRSVKQLSGGQQQRVALARAIVVRPAVLLLDEPLSALDKNLRENMQIELRHLQQQLKITTVFVTHDQEEALTMSDEIAVMNNGVVEQRGPPRQLYERPATEFIASFLGTSNFFDATVVGRDGAGTIVEIAGSRFVVAGEQVIGTKIRLSVRPESIHIDAAAGPGLPATIRDIVYRGPLTTFVLASQAGPVVATAQNSNQMAARWRVGDDVSCGWDANQATALRSSNAGS